jgi:predicted amidophosphoribosyltransferase
VADPPRYFGQILCCPDCGTDLDDGPYEAWCPACEREWSYARLLADVPDYQHPED